MIAAGLWARSISAIPHDDLATFFLAAEERQDDAWYLLGATGRELACVYLAGYAVEISLKSAILHLAGVLPGADVYAQLSSREGPQSVRNVKNHRLIELAENLIQRRANARVAVDPVFEGEILANAQMAAAEWNESLRYRAGIAFESDAVRMIELALWFVKNQRKMVY